MNKTVFGYVMKSRSIFLALGSILLLPFDVFARPAIYPKKDYMPGRKRYFICPNNTYIDSLWIDHVKDYTGIEYLTPEELLKSVRHESVYPHVDPNQEGRELESWLLNLTVLKGVSHRSEDAFKKKEDFFNQYFVNSYSRPPVYEGMYESRRMGFLGHYSKRFLHVEFYSKSGKKMILRVFGSGGYKAKLLDNDQNWHDVQLQGIVGHLKCHPEKPVFIFQSASNIVFEDVHAIGEDLDYPALILTTHFFIKGKPLSSVKRKTFAF